jgi:hypothetical protein
MNARLILGGGAVLLLAACATTPPNSPAVMVLPGSSKSFEQFRFDDHECRQYASAQVGGATPDQAASDSVGKSAVAGAAITRSGHGAVAGAGIGGAIGGAGAGSYSARTAQQRFDMGYQQCMYAKGHQIPMAGRYDRTPRSSNPTMVPPPPLPGTPPPPPPKS